MATNDRSCTIVPYFKVSEGNLDTFKSLCEQAVDRANGEAGCLYYGYSFNGDEAFCREAYADADAALFHLGNIAPVLQELLKVSEITRLEVHGPAEELAKLREPMAAMKPTFFTLEYGFRR